MNPKKGVYLVTAALILFCLGFSSANITIEEAQKYGAEFCGMASDELSMTGMETWFGRDCYVFRGPGEISIAVDCERARVRRAVLTENLRASDGVRLSSSQAEDIARKIAASESISFDPEMQLSSARFFDHGRAGKEYQFIWLKYSPEKVRLPTYLEICIAAKDGRLTSMLYAQEEPKVKLAPTIDRETAITKAATAANLFTPKVLDTELRVWFKDKEQVLWWVIDLQDSAGKETTVYLDAHSGEIFSILHSLGSRTRLKMPPFMVQQLEEAKADIKHLFEAHCMQVIPIRFVPSYLLQKVIGKANKNENYKEMKALLEEIKKSMKNLEPTGWRYAYRIKIKFYTPEGYMFICYYQPKESLLEVHFFKAINPRQMEQWQSDKLIKTEKIGQNIQYYVKDLKRPIFKLRKIDKMGKNYYLVGPISSMKLADGKRFHQILRKICKQWHPQLDRG